jgi:hypothetical protein
MPGLSARWHNLAEPGLQPAWEQAPGCGLIRGSEARVTITRKKFWLALFSGLGIVRAQEPELSQLESRPISTSLLTGVAWQNGPALNNQCPVCGTMAEPYVMQNTGHLVPCSHPKPGQACVAPVPGKTPESRTVRCQRCNARFDQDGI